MEPHSSSAWSQNGTWRLPLTLVLLLRSALAEPTSQQVTQTVPDLARWHNLNKSTRRLIDFINPFALRRDFASSVSVGMVQLTALCGIASALWLWTRRERKRKSASEIAIRKFS